MTIHRHWFFFCVTVLQFVGWALLPAVFWLSFLAIGLLSSESALLIAPFVSALFTLWLIVLWAALAIAWTDYYLDTWSVTETEIQHIEQTGFFDREVTTWQLDSVLDVNIHIDGFIPSFFNYGTFTIETAGDAGNNESFEGVPRPEQVKALILARVREIQNLAQKNHEQELQLKTVSHDAKGHLAKSEAVLAGIAEGDFGTVPESVKSIAETALKDARTGVSSMLHVLRTSPKSLFDFGAAIQTEVESAQPQARLKNLTLSVDAVSLIVFGDKETLTRDVVRNLISNAIIYTKQGSISVTLTSTEDEAILKVLDTGVGISEEDIPKLFTAGGHGAHSTDINPESTGNGLYIAQQVAKEHNGTLTVESNGLGSCFTLTLPLQNKS